MNAINQTIFDELMEWWNETHDDEEWDGNITFNEDHHFACDVERCANVHTFMMLLEDNNIMVCAHNSTSPLLSRYPNMFVPKGWVSMDISEQVINALMDVLEWNHDCTNMEDDEQYIITCINMMIYSLQQGGVYMKQ